MTGTPGTSGPPLQPAIKEYGVIWKVNGGSAIYSNNPIDPFSGDQTMERDEYGIPIIPASSNTNDDRNPDTEAGKKSWYHTEYRWNNTEIFYDSGAPSSDPDDRPESPLKGFSIEATAYEVTFQPGAPDGGDVEERTFSRYVPFKVKSAKIYSRDPNDGGTWVYPDDYDAIEDPNHPKQYGGVILETDNVPVELGAEDYFKSGIDVGPKNDGYVSWTASDGSTREAYSNYSYLDVFDEAKFSYIPRNSYENKELTRGESFQYNPMYPDLKDANGLAAPIYPMNTITAFLPDGRDNVTVTYVVELTIVAIVNNKEIPVENPVVTIKQTVEQDTGNYIEQLENLSQYTQFTNPRGLSQDELSPNYNYDYPYTLVTPYDVDPGVTPETRGEDTDFAPLQRGDVWYDGTTRRTWNISDIPESITVTKEGNGYKSNTNVPAIYMVPTDEDGIPLRCFTLDEPAEPIPSSLLVNTIAENGRIVSVTVSEDSSPTGWSDGDEIRIVGGNNNAMAKININNPAGWTEKFINKY